MADPIELLIGAERFVGFAGATVTQAFDEALSPTSFTLAYSPRVAEQIEAVLIEAGDAATLRVGDEDLVRGFVDDDVLSYTAQAAVFQAVGRSMVGDLLDCSAIHRSRRFRDQTIFEIAMALLADYDLTIQDRANDLTPIERFAIQEGESIADCLQRAARLRGVVLQDVAGDLVITRTGRERTSTVLERGRNVLTGQRRRSWRNRFSHYHFKGQTRTTDDLYGLAAAQIGHEIEDREITRTRRLSVVAHADRREDLGRRAVLERNVRAGKSQTLSYEVSGWFTDEGRLWRPNTLVRVLDPWFQVDAELLVQAVTLAYSTKPAQYRTQIELIRPETFAELDFPTRQRGGRWR